MSPPMTARQGGRDVAEGLSSSRIIARKESLQKREETKTTSRALAHSVALSIQTASAPPPPMYVSPQGIVYTWETCEPRVDLIDDDGRPREADCAAQGYIRGDATSKSTTCPDDCVLTPSTIFSRGDGGDGPLLPEVPLRAVPTLSRHRTDMVLSLVILGICSFSCICLIVTYRG